MMPRVPRAVRVSRVAEMLYRGHAVDHVCKQSMITMGVSESTARGYIRDARRTLEARRRRERVSA